MNTIYQKWGVGVCFGAMDRVCGDSHSLVVAEHEADLRLDRLLSLHFPDYSRTYFQSLIEQQSVVVNGKILKKGKKVEIGDEIEVCFLLPPEWDLQPENIPLNILYEDNHLIVVNKPKGMVVHPAPGHRCHTFVNALLFHCQNLQHTFSEEAIRPGIVHR